MRSDFLPPLVLMWRVLMTQRNINNILHVLPLLDGVWFGVSTPVRGQPVLDWGHLLPTRSIRTCEGSAQTPTPTWCHYDGFQGSVKADSLQKILEPWYDTVLHLIPTCTQDGAKSSPHWSLCIIWYLNCCLIVQFSPPCLDALFVFSRYVYQSFSAVNESCITFKTHKSAEHFEELFEAHLNVILPHATWGSPAKRMLDGKVGTVYCCTQLRWSPENDHVS